MKHIITALMLLPLSALAMQPCCKAIMSVRSLASKKEAITKEVTILLNKPYSELFDFSSTPNTWDEDKVMVKLVLLKMQNQKAIVKHTIVEERFCTGGKYTLTKEIPMNVPVNMNKLDPLDSLASLYKVQFDLTLSEQKES